MEKSPTPGKGIRRAELRTLIKLYPVFRRYLRDREKARKNSEGPWDEVLEENGKRAVKVFLDLGPTFIKLGQVLSARSDLLPKEYMKAFETLQDRVPPAPFSEVRQIIERNTGPLGEVFDEFNTEAISGASLGQVYIAKYKGTNVAVKVNRPNIEKILKRDLTVISRLLKLGRNRVDNFLYTSIFNVIQDFGSRIYDEIDYNKEKENIKRIGGNLRKRNEKVRVPMVIEEVTSKEVLVMEYITGTKITDVKGLSDKGIDLKRLAFRVDLLFIRMLLRDDIFHADPHPGNISVEDDGTIILYDFGMVGELNDDMRFSLLKLYAGLVESDPDMVIDSLLAMRALSPAANRGIIRRTMELAIAGLSGKRVEEREVREVFDIANNVIFEFPFRLPQSLVLYMRMSSLLEGVSQQLDPNFHFIAVLREILYKEGLLDEFYRKQLLDFGKRAIVSIEKGLDILPLLKRRLDEMETNNVHRKDSRMEVSIFLGFGLVALAYFHQYYPRISIVLIIADLIAFGLVVRKRRNGR